LEALGAVARASDKPPHALGAGEERAIEAPLDRAAENVRLVLEDPAAWVHNGPYARALLDEAERTLEKARP
jgi:hypothetical protein